MPVSFIDPISDGTAEWTPTPSGTHFSCIDEGTRQPSTPTTADFINAHVSDSSVFPQFIDEFRMNPIANVGSVSQVKIWIYGKVNSMFGAVKGDIKMAGAYIGADLDFGLTTSDSWKSITFNGNWTQADINNMLVKLGAYDPPPSMVEDDLTVYAMYAEVTYILIGKLYDAKIYDGKFY